MLKTRTIHVLLNASSGLGAGLSTRQRAPELLTRVFGESGAETHIHHMEGGQDLCELVRGLVRDGADVVVAGGGDGTINAVASVVAGTDVTMGVLPVGTLNHFARDLNIPLDIEAAAKVIAEGRTIQVDIGEVNGRRFINNAIIGLYPIYRLHRDRN
jgi:diacylglycerol kinase family enzyme